MRGQLYFLLYSEKITLLLKIKIKNKKTYKGEIDFCVYSVWGEKNIATRRARAEHAFLGLSRHLEQSHPNEAWGWSHEHSMPRGGWIGILKIIWF